MTTEPASHEHFFAAPELPTGVEPRRRPRWPPWTSVVAPVAEEFFFRGFFFAALRNWRGLWPAAIGTGVVFGAIHGSSSDAAFLLPLAFFGVSLCLIYAKTNSLYPCIALHCANNSVAFGTTQDWTWQIAVLFVGSIAVIGLAALAVQQKWNPRPPAPAP